MGQLKQTLHFWNRLVIGDLGSHDFSAVHGGAAAKGNDAVAAFGIVGFQTVINIFEGGVRLNAIKYSVVDAGLFQGFKKAVEQSHLH